MQGVSVRIINAMDDNGETGTDVSRQRSFIYNRRMRWQCKIGNLENKAQMKRTHTWGNLHLLTEYAIMHAIAIIYSSCHVYLKVACYFEALSLRKHCQCQLIFWLSTILLGACFSIKMMSYPVGNSSLSICPARVRSPHSQYLMGLLDSEGKTQ